MKALLRKTYRSLVAVEQWSAAEIRHRRGGNAPPNSSSRSSLPNWAVLMLGTGSGIALEWIADLRLAYLARRTARPAEPVAVALVLSCFRILKRRVEHAVHYALEWAIGSYWLLRAVLGRWSADSHGSAKRICPLLTGLAYDAGQILCLSTPSHQTLELHAEKWRNPWSVLLQWADAAPDLLRLDINVDRPSRVRVSFLADGSLLGSKNLELGPEIGGRPFSICMRALGLAPACGSGEGLLVLEPLGQEEPPWVNVLVDRYANRSTLLVTRREPLPSINILTVLYRKSAEIRKFAEALDAQDYPGPVSVIAVDDCCPEDTRGELAQYLKGRSSDAAVQWSVETNQQNVGNCASRNRGLDQASADIVVITDADCVIAPRFLREVLASFMLDEADVVIGAFNIESCHRDIGRLVNQLQTHLVQAICEADLQDRWHPESFLNCVTRGIALRSTWLRDRHFDMRFNYSASVKSGFGWEDVDFGYRLYRDGARMAFNPAAFTVHVTHPPNSDPLSLAGRGLRNLRALVEVHPELAMLCRDWLVKTLGNYSVWDPGIEATDDYGAIATLLYPPEQRLEVSPSHGRRQPRKPDRQLRILTYRWHAAHQYELYKSGHRFHLLRTRDRNLTPFTQSWEYQHRPMPANASFVELEDVNPLDYDLLLLHFDENVLDWQNTNGVIDSLWGASFRYCLEQIDLPKVAVCHGTPQFHGMYHQQYTGADLLEVIPGTRERLREYLGNCLVVCNSHQAEREWAFARSTTIWHGFDAREYRVGPRNQGILTLGGAMRERPYYRGYYFKEKTAQLLDGAVAFNSLKVREPRDITARTGNAYARMRFNNYIEAIGLFGIYFNPTLRSPMPRSRAEAMLCGLVTVNARNHDVDEFVENGKNGFVSDTPEEAAEQIRWLIDNPHQCRKLGDNSRATATRVFSSERYLNRWQEIFHGLVD